MELLPSSRLIDRRAAPSRRRDCFITARRTGEPRSSSLVGPRGSTPRLAVVNQILDVSPLDLLDYLAQPGHDAAAGDVDGAHGHVQFGRDLPRLAPVDR